jgi:hypothetical protein
MPGKLKFLQGVESFSQARDFAFELRKTIHHGVLGIALLARLGGNLLRSPAYSNAVGSAPFDFGLKIFVFGRKVEFETIGKRDGFGHLKPATIRRQFADDAIDAGEPIIKIDAALDKSLVTRKRAPFIHDEVGPKT